MFKPMSAPQHDGVSLASAVRWEMEWFYGFQTVVARFHQTKGQYGDDIIGF